MGRSPSVEPLGEEVTRSRPVERLEVRGEGANRLAGREGLGDASPLFAPGAPTVVPASAAIRPVRVEVGVARRAAAPTAVPTLAAGGGGALTARARAIGHNVFGVAADA